MSDVYVCYNEDGMQRGFYCPSDADKWVLEQKKLRHQDRCVPNYRMPEHKAKDCPEAFCVFHEGLDVE